jgi:DNA polymerase-3 subunit alpha
MSESPTFIHLRLHTEYSLLDGLTDVKALVKRCAKLGMPAVAITDHSNLFALVKFYKAAQGGGIKPIAGADVLVYNEAEPASPHLLSLYVQNETGYRTLTELISRAYRENQHQGVPQVMPDWLETTNQGLIALSGARQGQIGRAILAGNKDEARRLLKHWLGVFGDRFYLELQRTGRPHEEAYIEGAVELALEFDVPVVATNDVRFLDPTDFEAHEARVCIHQGRVLDDPRRPRDYTDQQYLKTPAEMAALFADLPEALENTVEIAKRCTLKLTLGKNYLPRFPVPEGMTPAEFFAEESRKGLRERLAVRAPTGKGTLEERTQAYWDRLELEIGVINQMDFPGYFLIVADFIQWAKNNGIPVGPGRGSGAGSLVAYALKITDLDPIEFDLLFERFLNPERVSMPDFDVDFCMDRRDEVIAYVADKYGRDQVSQIITYGSMAAKAVVRDVGRVLGHPYGFVDRIAKLIPFELGMTLEKALTDSEDLKKLYDTDEEVKALIDLAMSLEGLTRNAGKHAGGVVIAPSALIDFSPLYCEQGGDNLVTQFDKDDVEAVGLVKFDFLGLRTLTIIDWALEAINKSLAEQGKPPVDIAQIPLDDPPTYELLKSCQTTAVFQLESRGMKDLIKRLKPDCFEDIIALVALFRPGPLQSGMVDDYINVKHGRQQSEYAHPILEPILKPTNGVILYQEQVMRIAQDMAGYTLGGADLLRRAMGKKKVEEMAQQRDTFVNGAANNGVDRNIANFIFDLVDKFSGYGFNKTLAVGTNIYTANGIKFIEECGTGDEVFAVNPDGSSSKTQVVALHDHGLVPLWEIVFDDGAIERCTLDHKWLTRHGQWPLWAIIQSDEAVWGKPSLITAESETKPTQIEHDGELFAINTAIDETEQEQRQLWQSYISRPSPIISDHVRWQLDGNTVLRKPVRVTFLGWQQGYDLEVAHPEHNFLLASGLCCSNSHSAAYALVSYQTAWLKAHFPSAFMAAVLSSDMDKTDKVVVFIEECRQMKITLRPPDINRSEFRFTALPDGSIQYGLGAIKGVGENAITDLLDERRKNGAYADLYDLCKRIDLRKANRRVLEALIKGGALDAIDANRARFMAELPDALKAAEQHGAMEETGQDDLFGLSQPVIAEEKPRTFVAVEPWNESERLEHEKNTLGLYLTGHPISPYEDEIRQFVTDRLGPLSEKYDQSNLGGGGFGRRGNEVKVVVAGLIVELRAKQNKNGKRMGFATLDDRTGRLEVAVFSEAFEKYRDYLVKDTLLVVEGNLSFDDFAGQLRLSAERLMSIGDARAHFAKHLTIRWPEGQTVPMANELRDVLTPFRGGPCPIFIEYRGKSAEGRLLLGEAWRVRPGEELLERLGKSVGSERVKLIYQ